MRKSKILIMALVMTLVLSVFCFNTSVFATDIEDTKDGARTGITDENLVTTEDTELTEERHDGDLYVMFGEDDVNATSYTMDKIVDGNVFIFGKDVTITGKIVGSVFIFASNVTITEDSYIGGSVFAFGEKIQLDGPVYDMYAFAQDFTQGETGFIYRDLHLAGENVKILGKIGRDAQIAATSITVYEDEDARAQIGRNLEYTSEKEIADLDKADVYGEVKFTVEETDTEEDTKSISDYITSGIENIIFTLIVYAALIFLAPKFIEKSKEYVSTKGLLAAAIGLGFTVLVPIIVFILLLITYTVSMSFVMLMIYIIVLMINSAIVSIVANEYIANKVPSFNEIWKKLLLIIPVSLVLFILRQLPFIGGWITAIILFVGVGIVTMYQFNKRKNGEKEVVAE